eukprot:gene19356-22006_t
MDLELATVNPIAHKSDIECAATVVSSGDSESTTNTAKRDKGYWRRSSFYRRRDEHGNDFQITVPWSPQMYFSIRGAENFHIYLWILKDLAWTQKWYGMSWTFGILAISWIFVLAYHAFNDRNFNEIYMLIAMVLWLSANFVWMAGEVFSDDDGFVLDKAAAMMETSMAWIVFYYICLKPFKLLPSDEKMNEKYDDADLHPRFSCFSNWREYEHIHTFFWCGKDLAWNLDIMPMWLIFFIPTLLIGFDFMWVTYKSKTMAIDCAHYMAQFIWVIGNAAWAIGEIFVIPGGVDDDKGPYSVWHPTKTASHRCRWWSSVILVIAFAPIVALYLVWLPLTCFGHIKAADVPENEAFGRPSEAQPPVMEDMDRESEVEYGKNVPFSGDGTNNGNGSGCGEKIGTGESPAGPSEMLQTIPV